MELNKVITKLEKSKIKAGDGKNNGNYPLFTCSPTVNKYYDEFLYDTEVIILSTGGNPVINYYNGKFAYSTDCMAIKTNNEIKEKYLYYYLISRINKIEKMFRGVGIKHLNKNEFFKLEIEFPQIEVQEIVVEELDNLQSIIDIRKKQIQQFDELIKSQFVEMFKSKNYEKKRIGDFGKFQGGYAFKSKDFSENGIKLVRISNVNKDNLDWNEINRLPEEYIEKYKDYALNVGDVVMAMTRPIIKSLNEVKIAYVSENDVPCLLNQRVGRFLIDENKISKSYLTYCCKMDDFKNYVEKMSGNSLQPNISSKQVEDYTIETPPIEEQNKFSEFVKLIDKQKFEIQKSLDEMQNLYESLMDQYFG